MDSHTRRPVLTGRILKEDLPAILAVADGEIEYLQSRLEDTGTGAVADKLRAGMEARLGRLQRGRQWMAGTIAAVQEKRATTV